MTSEPAPTRSLVPRLAMAGAVVVTAAIVVAILVVVGAGQPGASASPSPTASVSGPSASPSSEPSPSPTASAAATAVPEATITPRAEWEVHQVFEPAEHAHLTGLAEARGQLLALGAAGFEQPGIWLSEDAESWQAATLPAAPSGLTLNVVDVVDAGQRLVALAAGGSSEGSGYFATAIFTSDDGVTWSAVDATPGPTVGAHFAMVRVADRLVAVGHSVWISDDAGPTWTEAVGRDVVGGTMVAMAERDGLLVAVGQAGDADVVEYPGLVWTSSDRGDTWQRIEMTGEVIPYAVAIGPDGRILIAVYGGESPLLASDDGGQSWSSAMEPGWSLAGVVAAPDGYLATGSRVDGDQSTLFTSSDGVAWESSPLAIGLGPEAEGGTSDVRWLPSYGLVLAFVTGSVALAPYPIP